MKTEGHSSDNFSKQARKHFPAMPRQVPLRSNSLSFFFSFFNVVLLFTYLPGDSLKQPIPDSKCLFWVRRYSVCIPSKDLMEALLSPLRGAARAEGQAWARVCSSWLPGPCSPRALLCPGLAVPQSWEWVSLS